MRFSFNNLYQLRERQLTKQIIKSKYKHLLKLCIAILLITNIPNILEAKDLCFIQIEAPVGIEIYLDGNLMGVTQPNKKYFIIQNIVSGKHKIAALKVGYYPQTDEIYIRPNEIYEYLVSPLIPKIKIKQEGIKNIQEIKKKVGNLLVRSLPIECKISIPSLRIIENKKKKDKWIADSIPIGTYQVKAQLENLVLDTFVEIKTNNEVQLMFNFVNKSMSIKDIFVKGIDTDELFNVEFDTGQIINIEISKQNLTIGTLCYKLGIVPDSTIHNSNFGIAEVRYYSPAYRTKIFIGDVVKRFNGETIRNESDLFSKIMKLPTDSTYLLEIEQKSPSGEVYIKTITMTLEEK